MTFDEALSNTMRLIAHLEELEKDPRMPKLARDSAKADRTAIAIMAAWAKKAYEKNEMAAVNILNAVHGV